MGFAENAVKTKTPAGLNWLSYCLSAVWTLPHCYTAKASLESWLLCHLSALCAGQGTALPLQATACWGLTQKASVIGHVGTLEEVKMKCTDPGMPLGRHLFL